MNKEWKYFITKTGYLYRYKPIYKNGYMKIDNYNKFSKQWEKFNHNVSLRFIECYPTITKLDAFKYITTGKI